MWVKTPKYVLDKIEAAVWEYVKKEYHGEDVFGPIHVIEHADDFDDDEIIHIYIFYDGDDVMLDRGFRWGVNEHVRKYVSSDEVPFIPIVEFFHKSWWKEVKTRVGKWIPEI